MAAIGSARKRVAQEEARILDAYFDGFNKASLDDYEINRRFRGRPEVNARLVTIRDDGKGDPLARARAAQLLCQFKDQTCWEGFARLLSAAPPVAARALSRFGELDDGTEFPPEHIIKQIALLVRSPSADVREAAVKACRKLGVPEAANDLLAILRGTVAGPKADAAEALAHDAPSVEVVALTAGIMRDTPSRDLDNMIARVALSALAGNSDRVVAEAARKALAAHASRPGATDDDKALAAEAQKSAHPVEGETRTLARQAATRLVDLGVIATTPDARTEAAAWRSRAGSPAEVSWLLMDALLAAGSVLWFDTETGFVPVRHDLLVHDLAGLSRGVFAPTAVWEEFKNPASKDDTDAPYLVQFVHQDRLYRVTAENLGDWYDVPSILAMANRAVADSGAKQQFAALYTGDQTARILFADPAAVKTAAAESLLALEDDPDSARRTGKAFEGQVIEQLKKKK